MDVEMKWFEELPEQCPPADAQSLDNFVCFRLCENSAPCDEDFHSHRQRAPHQRFNAPECIARAISVFKDREEAANLLKLAAHRNKSIVRLKLAPSDGVAKQTGRYKSHFSWWRSSLFDIGRAVEEDA